MTIARFSPAAELVSYAGAAPLLLCLIGVGMLPGYALRELAQRIALSYGAVLLAFTGAVHWGLALAGQMSWTRVRIAGAVLPALVAMAALLVGGQRGLALLVVGFGLFWVYEHRNAAPELPPAYLSARRNVSAAVCTLLALTMVLSNTVGLR